MDLVTLCNEINLQPEIKSKVFAFQKCFDFRTIEQQLNGFSDYQNIGKAHKELKMILGEDEDCVKILTCMLQASAAAYEVYKQKGICDEIYVATMKCYTRFIDEAYQKTGRLCFDRDWWTARQAGCHLFRIGELEYEILQKGNTVRIGLHIPSDADFSPSAVDQSVKRAKEFFRKYSAETQSAEYVCHSWLLDHQLRGMLKATSNILDFQNRFEIVAAGGADQEFIGWVFHRGSAEYGDYADLPEDTSLQRNMKKHLLSGGIIRSAFGKMKETAGIL